jgi:hypothetical protein
MARLVSIGFENNDHDELTYAGGALYGSPTISSSVKRSGGYAGRISSLTSATRMGWLVNTVAAGGLAPTFFRFYLRIDTAPSAANTIAVFGSNFPGLSDVLALRLHADRTLRLYAPVGTSEIGAATSPLTTGEWYRVEVMYERSASGADPRVSLRINGTTVVDNVSCPDSGNNNFWALGGNLLQEAQTTGDWFFDDVAVNDNTGSLQNSWCGEGHIVHLRPNAAGANNTWRQNNTTTANGNNYLQVDEVTPDGDSSYQRRNQTGDRIDDFNVTDPGDAGIPEGAEVSLVAVGAVVGSTNATATNRQGRFRLRTSGSGTLVESSAVNFNIVGWAYHNAAASSLVGYQLIQYQNPATSAAWTRAQLTDIQIGYINHTSSTTEIRVTAVWALVEYQELRELNLAVDFVEFFPTASGTAFTHSAAETINYTSTNVRAITRALQDTFLVTATVATIATLYRTFTQAINLTSSVNKSLSAFLSQLVTLLDTQARLFGKVKNESVTFASALSRSLTRAFAEVVAFTSTIARALSRSRSEVVNLADTQARLFGKIRSETSNYTSALSRSLARTRSEVVQAVDSRIRQLTRSIQETATYVSTFAFSVTLTFAVNETIQYTSAVARSVARALSEIASYVTTITRQATRTIVETIQIIADFITSTQATQALSDTVTATSTITRSASKVVAETVQYLSAISRSMTRTLADAPTFVSSIAKQSARQLADVAAFTTQITRALVRSLVETVTGATSLARNATRLLSETVTYTTQMIFGTKVYSRAASASLPTVTTDLATLYSDAEIIDTEAVDNVRVNLEGAEAEYAVHQFRHLFDNATSNIYISVTLQTDIDPSVSPVRLQLYNFNTASWETFDTDATTAINTNITLNADVTTNPGYYRNGLNWVYSRVYQQESI